jgi:hemerythrin-like domain-containing protein
MTAVCQCGTDAPLRVVQTVEDNGSSSSKMRTHQRTVGGDDMGPIEELEQEHELIGRVIGAAGVLAEKLAVGCEVEAQLLLDMVEFLHIFVGQCHHGKEEQYMFRLLESRGIPSGGCPLAALRHEHQSGSGLLEQFSAAVGEYRRTPVGNLEPLLRALQGLTDLYPGHIWKEDFLLFPMSRKVLSSEDQRTISEGFRRIEAEIGPDVHHAFEDLAARIIAAAALVGTGDEHCQTAV